MVKLSILIPSMPSRIKHLDKLLNILTPQLTNEVELIVLMDNKIISLWNKRNQLLNLSHWKYVVWIDDDDVITDDYISELLKAIEYDTDCITFDMEISIDWWLNKKVYFSKSYEYVNKDDCYYRKPHWLMCYKRDIAMKEKFADITFREDTEYSERICNHINTEYNIPKTLYYYNFISTKTY